MKDNIARIRSKNSANCLVAGAGKRLFLQGSRLSDFVHQVNFALISSEHELVCERIFRIFFGRLPGGRNRAVHNRHVVFIFDLKRRSHRWLILKSVAKFGDGIFILALLPCERRRLRLFWLSASGGLRLSYDDESRRFGGPGFDYLIRSLPCAWRWRVLRRRSKQWWIIVDSNRWSLLLL